MLTKFVKSGMAAATLACSVFAMSPVHAQELVLSQDQIDMMVSMMMKNADKNSDHMVSKKELMARMEKAMKMADPKGTGMYDKAMLQKFFKEFYGSN